MGKWYRLAERYVSAFELLVKQNGEQSEIYRANLQLNERCTRATEQREKRASEFVDLPPGPIEIGEVRDAIRDLSETLRAVRAQFASRLAGTDKSESNG